MDTYIMMPLRPQGHEATRLKICLEKDQNDQKTGRVYRLEVAGHDPDDFEFITTHRDTALELMAFGHATKQSMASWLDECIDVQDKVVLYPSNKTGVKQHSYLIHRSESLGATSFTFSPSQ